MTSNARANLNWGEALIEVEALPDLMIQGNGKLLVVQRAPPWLYLRHHIPGSRQAWFLELESQAFERWASSQGIYYDSQVVVVNIRYDATYL